MRIADHLRDMNPEPNWKPDVWGCVAVALVILVALVVSLWP